MLDQTHRIRAQDQSHVHTYINTYTSMYVCTLHPSQSPLDQFCLTQISLIRTQACLITSTLFSPWTSVSSLSHYFDILAISVFCRVLSLPSFVLTKTIHLLPHLFPHLSLFPRHFSFLVLFFFNGGCLFFQLILPLTLQITWKLCGMNFFNLLILYLQTYCHLNFILLQLTLVSGRDVNFF